MTTTKAKSKSVGINQKLYDIMCGLEYIQKDKRNDHFGYNYLSEQAIKTAIQPLLKEHRVMFFLKTCLVSQQGNLTSADFIAEFVDVDTGEKVEIGCHGQGQDNSDKGYPKSVTNAIKYVLTSTFLIPTGDDPEQGNGQPQTQPATHAAPAPETTLAGDGPTCPKCESFMRLKPAGETKSGRKYDAFWSCGKYPDCKGTVKAEVFEQELDGHQGTFVDDGLAAEDVFS